MSNRQTVAWKQVRAARPPNEEAVAAHVARFRQEARAWQLREIREAQGLTQQEVAQRMDITAPGCSRRSPARGTSRPHPCGTS
jgi:DNA-binding transcriptional regulator YiaG